MSRSINSDILLVVIVENVYKGILLFVSLHTQDLESCRQVQFDEVMEYCKSIRCPLVETSAKVRAI